MNIPLDLYLELLDHLNIHDIVNLSIANTLDLPNRWIVLNRSMLGTLGTACSKCHTFVEHNNLCMICEGVVCKKCLGRCHTCKISICLKCMQHCKYCKEDNDRGYCQKCVTFSYSCMQCWEKDRVCSFHLNLWDAYHVCNRVNDNW